MSAWAAMMSRATAAGVALLDRTFVTEIVTPWVGVPVSSGIHGSTIAVRPMSATDAAGAATQRQRTASAASTTNAIATSAGSRTATSSKKTDVSRSRNHSHG